MYIIYRLKLVEHIGFKLALKLRALQYVMHLKYIYIYMCVNIANYFSIQAPNGVIIIIKSRLCSIVIASPAYAQLVAPPPVFLVPHGHGSLCFIQRWKGYM